MKVFAVVPARSGSKGLPDKNIRVLGDHELMVHSIRFAQALGVDAVICSTDSPRYAEIAELAGAHALGLRSPEASSDTAMEPAVLDDVRAKLQHSTFGIPDIIVWLRPTFVFRSIQAVQACIDDVRSGRGTSSRVVTEEDPRVYKAVNGRLQPGFETGPASMVRRQDMPGPLYRVYSADVFPTPNDPCPQDFLGDDVRFNIAPKICGLDIDDFDDFQLVDAMLERIGSAILD